jgi:hypothetical protein
VSLFLLLELRFLSPKIVAKVLYPNEEQDRNNETPLWVEGSMAPT